MSYKTTLTISRDRALEIIQADIFKVGNDVLGSILDVIADSQQSHEISHFNNFHVSK
jgi:hypothetical protein